MDTSLSSDQNHSGDDSAPAPAPNVPAADSPATAPSVTAAESLPENGFPSKMGPDCPNVHEGRPYFLVPLDKDTNQYQTICQRIEDHIAKTGQPVTDIFIFSHGWHRNFYGAVAAYDRIAARNAQLLYRERFKTIRRGPPFHPLFLMLHWHSDPGVNKWVDYAGRRSKTGFLEACEQRFVRSDDASLSPDERFTTVFEDLFDLFSKMSAPDSEAIDAQITAVSEQLSQRLDRFSLRDAPRAHRTDKIAAVWSAYHTAPVREFVVNQSRKPGYLIRPGEAFANLANFLLRVVPLALLLGVFFRVWQYLPGASLVEKARDTITTAFTWCTTLVQQWLPLSPRTDTPDAQGVTSWAISLTLLSWMLALSGVAALLLGFTPRLFGNPKDRVGLFRLIGWLLIAVPFALPLLLFLFATYFTAPIWPWIVKVINGERRLPRPRGLFDERFGSRGADIDDVGIKKWLRPAAEGSGERPRVSRKFARYHLARFARVPVTLLRAGLDPENPGHPLVNAVDNQFAFWRMQVQGVAAGRQAAYFFANLHKRLQERSLPDNTKLLSEDARIHLLGHSFGGLVVANMARHLCHDPKCRSSEAQETRQVKKISTLCFLNAAIAATWFEDEEEVVNYVEDGIGCIYSVSDTANGFYYPVANNGRLAAGFVGLYKVGGEAPTTTSLAETRPVFSLPQNNHAMFASLVTPPDLKADVAEQVTQVQGNITPLVINLDGSRLLFQGAPAMGGGHGDVFKDDVSHLCWAVTRIGL